MRLQGTIEQFADGNVDHRDIQVWGVLGAGPNAQRSPTSFFQDGDCQEKACRAIGRDHRFLDEMDYTKPPHQCFALHNPLHSIEVPYKLIGNGNAWNIHSPSKRSKRHLPERVR
jgi:hypothetical protein